jgi:hypothetical protein
MVNQICGCDREGSAPQLSRRSVGSRWINVGRLWAALFAVHKRSTCSPLLGEIHGLSTRSPANNHGEGAEDEHESMWNEFDATRPERSPKAQRSTLNSPQLVSQSC